VWRREYLLSSPGASEVRERMSVSKRTARKFDMERFSLKKSNRFAAVESLDDSEPINRVWEAITWNIKVSAKESLGQCKGGVINHRLLKNVQNL